MPKRLSEPMVQNCVTMLAHSPKGMTVARMLEGVTLPDDYALVADRCSAYWRRHKQPPGVHLIDLFVDVFDKPGDPRAAPVRYILDQTLQTKDGINEDFVLGRMSDFLALNAMKAGMIEVFERLGQEDEDEARTVEEASAMIGTLMRARRVEFNPGVKLTDRDDFVKWLHRDRGIHLAIEPLDRIGVQPQRGTLWTTIAVTGQGKTWWLVHVGKQALRQGLKVVHISLEIDNMAVLGRYYQSLWQASEYQVQHRISSIEKDLTGRMIGIQEKVIDPEFAFRDTTGTVNRTLPTELTQHLNELEDHVDNLRIRTWPPRVASIDTVETYLDVLADAEHFEPDVILVDYPQLMRLNVSHYRLELGQTVEHLRRLAIERNCAVVIVHQASRAGAQSKSVGMTHVAEDWSVVQTSDFVLSYSATEGEQARGLARLHVAKARAPSAVGRTMILSQNYDIGQYAVSAVETPANYATWMEEQRSASSAAPPASDADDAGLY